MQRTPTVRALVRIPQRPRVVQQDLEVYGGSPTRGVLVQPGQPRGQSRRYDAVHRMQGRWRALTSTR